MNYTELVAAIESTVENTFETADMDRFIRNAEQRIFNSIDFPLARKVSSTALTSGTRYLDCPTDFLAVYSFAIIAPTGAYTYLLPKDANFIREAYPNPTSTGTPKYYAIFGGQAADAQELTLVLGPTPNASLTTELHYFYYPESITVASGGQTWLGDTLDMLLLYASLVEAYTFMKGEADMMAVYETKYKESLMLAKKLGDGLEKSDAYRNGTPRVPVG